MGEEEYEPVPCMKCGMFINEEEHLVVLVYPPQLEYEDFYLHWWCAEKIRKFCKDAQEGKRVRGW